MIHARFDEMMAEGAAELAELASRRTQLEGEQQKLLQAHYAGAIPLDLLKREQDRITASLETIEHRISAHHGHYADARANLDDALASLAGEAASEPAMLMAARNALVALGVVLVGHGAGMARRGSAPLRPEAAGATG